MENGSSFIRLRLNDQDWLDCVQVVTAVSVTLPISPWGVGLTAMFELHLNQWRCVLSDGNPISNAHPDGGGMTSEACNESLRGPWNFLLNTTRNPTCGHYHRFLDLQSPA